MFSCPYYLGYSCQTRPCPKIENSQPNCGDCSLYIGCEGCRFFENLALCPRFRNENN